MYIRNQSIGKARLVLLLHRVWPDTFVCDKNKEVRKIVSLMSAAVCK